MVDTTKKVSKGREHWAWYLYDFGSSAYAAVVLLAVYSHYFKDSVVGGSDGSLWWGIATGIAMLTVAVISPVLGTLADFSGSKKKVLLVMTTMSVIATALLFTVGEGDLLTGVLFFVIAEIGYRGGQVFYNSLLPEIASQDEIGKVSGNGWAIGSAGGILCLGIVLGLIMTFEGETIVRFSFLITALFFAASTIPLFLWVRERTEPQKLEKGDNYYKVARRRLAETIKSVGSFKEFLKFMLAFLIYNDGVLSALNFAAIIGGVLFGMDQTQLVIMMIITQVTSVIGAYVYGLIGERYGFKSGLIQSLLLMIAAVIAIYFNTTIGGFLIIVGVAGFALTGVQSLSRTMIGAFAPPGKSAEFYGFFGMVGRTSSFIGPFLFGWLVDFIADNLVATGVLPEVAEKTGHRQGVFLIVAFLVVGLGLLLFVNEKKGRKVALGEAISQPGD